MQRHFRVRLVVGLALVLSAVALGRTGHSGRRVDHRGEGRNHLAHAAPQSTPWPVKLAPVADTWAWRFARQTPTPAAAHGAEAVLVTGIDDTVGTQAAFLRFDIASMTWPPDWLKSATLTLTIASESQRSGRVHASKVHRVEAPWEEASLLDGFAPPVSSALASAEPPGGVMAWDVTDLVRAWMEGKPNHGLAVSTMDDLFFTREFHSREAAMGRPELLVWIMPRMTFMPPTPTPESTMTPTPHEATPTGTFAPDLVGSALRGCDGQLSVRLRNVGQAAAGPFSVAATDGSVRWRVATGLNAGWNLRLPPKPGGAMDLIVDADGEIWESDEANNRVPVAVQVCHMYLPRLASSR